MDSANVRPVEDLVGQPVLQVTGARRHRGALQLRHVDYHFRASLACGRGEDGGRFQQAIVNRISELAQPTWRTQSAVAPSLDSGRS